MKKLKITLAVLLVIIAAISCYNSCVYTYSLAARLEQVESSSRADMNYLRRLIRSLDAELTQSVINRLEEIGRPIAEDTQPETESQTQSAPALEAESTSTTDDETIPSTESGTESEAVIETLPTLLPDTLPAEGESTYPADTDGETETKTELTDSLPVETESEIVADGETERDSMTEQETASDSESETIPEWEILHPETETCTETETALETEIVELPTHGQPETTPTTALYTIAAHKGSIGVFDATGRLVHTANVCLYALPLHDREALTVGIPAYTREEMIEIVARYE